MTKDSTLPHVRSDLSLHTLQDTLVVYDRTNRRVHSLNSTGEYIWRRCDGRMTVQELANEISAEFQTPPEQALSDVLELLASFSKERLLQV